LRSKKNRTRHLFRKVPAPLSLTGGGCLIV